MHLTSKDTERELLRTVVRRMESVFDARGSILRGVDGSASWVAMNF